MQKIFNKIACITATLILFISCKKEGDQFNLHEGTTSKQYSLNVDATNILLNGNNKENNVLSFFWQKADFGVQPVVTYTLQVANVADTAENWAHAKNFTMATNTFTFSFIGKALNDVVTSLGFPANVSNRVLFRVKSEVSQFNGAASTVAPVYSNILAVYITTYELNLYVPGDYQNWDPASAPQIAPASGHPGMYEGYVYMAAPGQHYFKYTNAPDWDHTNYGDGGGGTFSTDGNAAGLSVPDGGYYELTANLNTNTWTATKTTWGIIGDASPGGWSTDTPMAYDPATEVWTVTLNMVTAGSFKFRANGAWSIDFGIDSNGKLLYADNPFFGYVSGLNNLTVPSDGNYTITLDLHVSGHYDYILHKN